MKKQISIPILNNEYRVIVVYGDATYVQKVLKQKGYKPKVSKKFLEENRGACFYNKNCVDPIIFLPKKPETPEEIGILAHEAVHAIDFLFQHLGEHHYDEIFAHSVAAVVRETLLKTP